jgi:predicted dehydrogenase
MAYKVAVTGMGKRGGHHAAAFAKNRRFEVVAVCDPEQARLDKVPAEVAGAAKFTSAEAMLKSVKPDIFCFCTPPTVRLPLIKLGIQSGARMIAYEKPIALSMTEAIEVKKLVDAAGIKTVVSHQHRYGEHYRKVKEITASGALGRLNTVYGTSPGWMMHMITHMVDLMRWYNGEAEAEWVMGQASGRGKLSDIHPSPDYIGGMIHFANGVRGYVETGAGVEDIPGVEKWWAKNRVGAKGDDGFAEAITGGGWRSVAKDGLKSGPGAMNYDLDMPPYVDEMADWLDDEKKVHQCNGNNAYKGFEIVMALLRSVVERGQVALPLGPGEPELEALKRVIPEKKVLLSCEGNRKEFPA